MLFTSKVSPPYLSHYLSRRKFLFYCFVTILIHLYVFNVLLVALSFFVNGLANLVVISLSVFVGFLPRCFSSFFA